MSTAAQTGTADAGKKPTRAQLDWLRRHERLGGTLSKFTVGIGGMTYVMAGKLKANGWITIKHGRHLSWPYGWDSTSLTKAGRAALAAAKTGGA